jgi:hypothetical protein
VDSRPAGRGAARPGAFYQELGCGLIAHAEHQFRLNSPNDPDARKAELERKRVPTWRDTVASGVEQKALGAEWLIGPLCPPPLRYVLEWFLELAAARGSSGFGISPLSFTEIKAWSELTGRRLSAAEVRLLRALDAAFLQVHREPGFPELENLSARDGD